MNSDYIPLDQAVIDREVKRLEENRRKARVVLRNASKEAGGNSDIIVFHDIRKNFNRFKRIIRALEALNIFWCEHDDEILASRHEVEDYIRD